MDPSVADGWRVVPPRKPDAGIVGRSGGDRPTVGGGAMAGPVSAVVLQVGHRRRRRLEKIVARASNPQFLVLRARIVLLVAEGVSLAKVAARLDTTETTVRKWRGRFAVHGIKELLD